MAAPASIPSGRSFGSRRLWIGVASAALLLALAWSAAWFYVPPLVAGAAEERSLDKLGRRLTLGHVAFNPWTLELTIDDLALAGAGAGAPPQLEVKRIHADAAIVSLFRLAPVIDSLEIDAPVVRVARVDEGRYDIDDVLEHLAAAPPAEHPPRFALHNIVVRDGSVDFVDRPLATTHRLRDLALGVPFLSTLASERDIKVEPHLAFDLDGGRFDSAATATPFAQKGNGEVHLQFDGFAVGPYLGYLPRGMPARLRKATLGADLAIAFERQPKLSLKITGTIAASDIEVLDTSSQDLMQAGDIRFVIDDLRPLERRVAVKSVEIDAPHVVAVRKGDGKVNLLLAAEAASGETTALAPVPLPTTAATPATPWKATVGALSVRAGRLDWRDATTTPPAALGFDDFSLAATAIGWPLDAPVVFKGEGTLGAGSERGKLSFSGQGNAAAATVKVALVELPLALLRPYLRAALEAPLSGQLDADLELAWHAGQGAPQLVVDARRVALTKLALGAGETPDAALDEIELTDARIDLAARSAEIGRIALNAPRVRVERDAKRQWGFERWQTASPTAPKAPGASAAPAPAASASAAPPWKLALGELAVTRGRVDFSDLALARPAAVSVTDLAINLRGWAPAASVAPFRVAARVVVPPGSTGRAVGAGVTGVIDVRGELKGFSHGVPASAQAAVLLKDVPLHVVGPYLEDFRSFAVQRAQTSFKGHVRWERRGAGASVGMRGDVTVDELLVLTQDAERADPRPALTMVADGASGRQLLAWKSLSLRGIDLAMAPGTSPRLAVAETALSDFFARVVLDENGRLNLQDVARRAAPADAASAPAGGASAAVAAAPGAPQALVVAAAPTPAPAASGPRPIVNFGPIAVVNGRVAYNDRFVKPNYSADLSELRGRLAAFSSEPPAPGAAPLLADIDLHGRVAGTGSLDITGKVNPLATPLALDLQAKVRELELPPLSPYAIKYAGYGIERGKLSVDLAYVVEPSGQLTANNKIVLNQLVFGDKVPESSANLPVKLAVALLADQHGVIDVDLPVSGSINDPQFSLGGLIWKAITNLIVKAVTAPFHLIASAFGGSGEELSRIEFAPGSATLDATAQASLDKVAQALVDRPGLSLTVTGESRLDSERDAWKKERLKQLVRAEKRRQAIAGGADATAAVTVGDDEYPALLKEVYRRADIVKPKNFVGLTKDLSTAEMEQLLLANMTVADDAMQQLAVRRGVAVRDYLVTREVAVGRLFLGAPKIASDDAAWTPRADLTLAAS